MTLSLRTRLLLGLLGLAAVGLVILDVVSYSALRSYLSARSDQQVEAAVAPVGRALFTGHGNLPPPPSGSELPPGTPSPPAGSSGAGLPPPPGAEGRGAQGGTAGDARTEPDAGAGPEPQLPPGTYGELRNANGKVKGHVLFSYGESGLGRPRIPPNVPISGPTKGRHAFDVPSSGSGSDYRAIAVQSPVDSGTVIAAVPLRDFNQTLSHLRVIELIVSAAVLAALAAVAWWVIRVGLRPLARMEATANAIAAGDLSRRVETTDERTEVGRLGSALNKMLAQIERAFRERQASEDRLRQFLADASHELRTPLSSIRGYAEIFRLGPAQNPERLATAMRRIEDEAARMGVLVDDLLTLARLDEVREPVREPVYLEALAADACEDARAAAPDRDIELDVAEPGSVLGDGDQLRQVITNLLRNALSHTPTGTPVEVTVGRANGGVTVAVRDHGPGLPSGIGDQVFERFWRQGNSRNRDGRSAGLGLAIVAAIVSAHGGEAHAGNAPDGGAVFRIELPARS